MGLVLGYDWESLTSAEQQALVYTVLGEARGEGSQGMAAVMHVILNRAGDKRWPDNPALVAKQKSDNGIYAFSAWNTKAMGGNSPTRISQNSAIYKQAETVVREVFAGSDKWPDPTGNAVFFWSGNNDPYWADEEATSYGRIKVYGHTFLARAPVVATDVSVRRVAPVPKRMGARMGVTRMNTPETYPDPVFEELRARVNRMPDKATTTTSFGMFPSKSDLDAWRRQAGAAPIPATRTAQAQQLTTVVRPTVPINPQTGMPYSQTALQFAVDRKALQIGTEKYALQMTANEAARRRRQQVIDAAPRGRAQPVPVTRRATPVTPQRTIRPEPVTKKVTATEARLAPGPTNLDFVHDAATTPKGPRGRGRPAKAPRLSTTAAPALEVAPRPAPRRPTERPEPPLPRRRPTPRQLDVQRQRQQERQRIAVEQQVRRYVVMRLQPAAVVQPAPVVVPKYPTRTPIENIWTPTNTPQSLTGAADW